MSKKWIITSVITGFLVIFAASVGPIMSRVETPSYQSLGIEKNIEIRRYAPMVIAEVEVKGLREAAINQGFRMLADYIFGNNVSKQEIAMTAPVQQQSTIDAWKINFVIPSEYTLEDLPKPTNPAVTLRSVSQKDYVVLRYSGSITDENVLMHEQELIQYIEAKKIKAIGTPLYGFYNPPWTLPFLRRNEIMMEIEYHGQ